MDISKLVEQYPNDMELGAAVREIYWKNRKQHDELMEKMKDSKIYESPDGGKTIYERPFGASHTERTLVDKSQLSIFPKEVEFTD